MKTFKQYSKDSKEDKGYYINKDGVAVILEPIHFKYPYGRDDDDDEDV
jgi:hypothetical protein